MDFEQAVNQELNKHPGVKKGIKRTYQVLNYTLSSKKAAKGRIIRVSPDDMEHEYFFGYYGICPEDANGRHILCMKAEDTWSNVAPGTPAEILLIDKEKSEGDLDKVKTIGITHSWNVQQGCMAQWLGPDFSERVIYNDYREGNFCSVITNIYSGEERILPAPIYSVNREGTFALTLDFARLHRMRPGYGYSNIEDETKGQMIPDGPCIWKVDISSGKITPVLKYSDFVSFEPRPEMEGAEHKVNHIMISPNGKRFMVLHRWFKGERKYSRLLTVNVDGTEMYNLSDDDMVSHCFWKNNQSILAFENKKAGGHGYYLMKDRSSKYKRMWKNISADGHPSYYDGTDLVATDTYPDRNRIASVRVMQSSAIKCIGEVFAPFKYDNDTRCDLHPRWSRDGKNIYIDSVHEGHRGLYRIPVYEDAEDSGMKRQKVSVIIPVYKVEKYLHRCVDSVLNQTHDNMEIILVDDGSPDNCGLMCDDYAEKDSRIRVIHKQNGGLSSARNAGLDVANGDFICFVDSDDWIEKDMIGLLLSNIMKSEADVADIRCIQTDGIKIIPVIESEESEIYEGQDILQHYLHRGMSEQNGAPFSVGRKMYRSQLLRDIRFEEGSVNEDICFNFKVLQKCRREIVSKRIGYYYFQNPNSLTSGKLKEKDFDLLTVTDELLDFAETTGNQKIIELARMKRARSDYSLLARGAMYGVDSSVDQASLDELARNLKRNLVLLLNSPMSNARKFVCIGFSINYPVFRNVIRLAGRLKKIK